MPVFPVEYKRLLGTLLIVTAVLGPLAAVVTGIDALIGVVYLAGFLVVVPLVTWRGDGLSFVAARPSGSASRRVGREFEDGRRRAREGE